MRLAYVLDGSLAATDWRAEFERGRRPHFEFTYAEASLGAELICQDDIADPRFAAKAPLRRLWASLALADFVHHRRERFDRVVFSDEKIGAFTALRGFLDRDAAPRLTALCHGHLLQDRRFVALLRLALRNPSLHLLCLSTSIAAMVERQAPFARDRIHEGGLAVDTDYFSPRESDRRLVVAAGSAHRDYATLVSAVADLDVQTRIAADSTWIGSTPVEVGEALAGKIVVGTAGDYAGLRALYEAALCVVVPMEDRPHACGYAVISEAMACGKPVIVTHTRAPSDLVEDGVTGILVPPGDVGALREALRRLLDDPALARAMGAAARRKAEATCSLGAFREKIMN